MLASRRDALPGRRDAGLERRRDDVSIRLRRAAWRRRVGRWSAHVVVAGGLNAAATILGATERFNPAFGTFSSAGTIAPRYGHTASLLAADYVLAVGGASSSTVCHRSVYKYNPATNSWSIAATETPRCSHTATVLANGKVLVAGGDSAPGGPQLNTANLYDPIGNTWTAQPTLAAARREQTAALYPSSPTAKVLLAGGYNGNPMASAECYTP